MASRINKKIGEKRETQLMRLAGSKEYKDESQSSIARELINSGAYLDLKNYKSETALMIAAKKNKVEMVDELLKNGANIEIENYRGRNAITIAIEKNNIKVVKKMLEYCDINRKNRQGHTLLIESIYLKKFDIAKMLIEKNADLNIEYCGETALFIATSVYGDIEKSLMDQCREIIKILISAGSATTIGGDLNILMYMSMFASTDEDLEIITQLIDSGIDPNSVNRNRISSIAYAYTNFTMPDTVIRLLLKRGADLKFLDCDCNIPLLSDLYNLVIMAGSDISIVDLVDSDVDLNFSDRKNSFLHDCLPKKDATPEHVRLYKSLFRKGADPNKTFKQLSLLRKICIYNNLYDPELVRFLINSGADVENDLLRVLVNGTITENAYRIAEILIINGIDVNYAVNLGYGRRNILYHPGLSDRRHCNQNNKYYYKMLELLVVNGLHLEFSDGVRDSDFTKQSFEHLFHYVEERALVKDNKRRFSKVVKNIGLHASRVKLHPDSHGAKILEYCFVCAGDTEALFQKIKKEDPYLLDYLDIQKPEDLGKLQAYRELV